jgi:23S rRNA (uracil1939-C5)-methyltransferase
MARRSLPEAPVSVVIDALDHDGRGVARSGGKVTFVEGALPGERVLARYTRRRGRFDEARTAALLRPSAERARPRCPHFGTCGGCSLQHLEPAAQIRRKAERLAEALEHGAGARPEAWLPPLPGPAWGYRRKARLGARYVAKKGRLLVGFRERRSAKVADLGRCPVLHPAVGERLAELRDCLGGLEALRAVPQVEVAVGDDRTVLVLRHLEPLSAADRARLGEYAAASGVDLCLQPGGPETVARLDGSPCPPLEYRMPEHDVVLRFAPTDFVQVNADINRALVGRVLKQLAPRPGEAVLDLFCGLGNFSLPLARHAGRVIGVEGDAASVARARENAAANGLANLDFHRADLSDAETVAGAPWLRAGAARWLLDPPRSGALAVVDALGGLAPAERPGRIVYVSCNPATLARDLGVLVNAHGYRLRRAGVMDMFPHTSHVESMAVLDAPGRRQERIPSP